MAYSKVYKDGEYLVSLVAHEVGNALMSYYAGVKLTGLIEYQLDTTDGVLRAYDGDDEVIFDVDKSWVGLNKDAISDLIAAAESGDAEKVGEEYFKILARYRKNTDDPVGALVGDGLPVGTVVRVDSTDGVSPEEADVLIKRSVDWWEATGMLTTWSDEDVLAMDYEVIYGG